LVDFLVQIVASPSLDREIHNIVVALSVIQRGALGVIVPDIDLFKILASYLIAQAVQRKAGLGTGNCKLYIKFERGMWVVYLP
jgi:hypothetical protein